MASGGTTTGTYVPWVRELRWGRVLSSDIVTHVWCMESCLCVNADVNILTLTGVNILTLTVDRLWAIIAKQNSPSVGLFTH